MTTTRVHAYRDWNRYQWASIPPPPHEDNGPRWNAVHWVGDQGRGARSRPIDPATAPEGESKLSGFGHSAGVNHWALGYRH